MTGPARPVAEDDLHACVDGVLAEERRVAVEHYLQTHPEAAERVAAYRAHRQALRAALSARMHDPIPPTLDLARLLEARLRRRRNSWRVAATVALALGAGIASGWVAGRHTHARRDRPDRPGSRDQLCHLCFRHAPPPVEIGAVQREDLTRWLTNRLNHPVAPPDLSSLDYQRLGGRLVTSLHGPAALFLYENPGGKRLGIYARPIAGQTTPLEPTDVNDIDGCTWIERGIGYSLMAEEPYGRLEEFTRRVRQELNAQG